MKTVIYNNNNLTEEEIDRTVRKVRCVILNPKGQMAISRYAGIYLLPGGSIEEGENELTAIKREVQEETGIVDLQFDEEECFLQLISYNHNYYDRKFKREINRKTDTKFFFAKTNNDIDLEKVNLTESEKNNGFEVSFINPSKVEYLLQNNTTTNRKNEEFKREILLVLREFTKYRTEKDKAKQER